MKETIHGYEKNKMEKPYTLTTWFMMNKEKSY